MVARPVANCFVGILRDCYRRPHGSLCLDQRRSYARQAEPLEVGVLGGGITGLASAYYLSREKNTRVTLFESGSRLGGWLRSTSVDVGNGKVIFEQGPRTLRSNPPNGLVTLDLIRQLGLKDEVLITSKQSDAAKNRFIYYPDHLVRMPGPGQSLWQILKTLFSEPVFQGIVRGALTEIFEPQRQPNLIDESVSSFLTRRFGPALADNIVSAVFHGIYAGDLDRLSARSLLSSLWEYEASAGSVGNGLFQRLLEGSKLVDPLDLGLVDRLRSYMVDDAGDPLPGLEIFRDIRQSSVYTFRTGIGRLAEKLEEELEASTNVKIERNAKVESLEFIHEGDRSVRVRYTPKEKNDQDAVSQAFSHVVSTISGTAVSAIASPFGSLSSLALTPSATVMVVNLFYSSPSLLPVRGFGYLLPRSIPLSQNPERALGVVFDSDAAVGQDDVPGTKLTVMLGGHWWDGWSAYPDEEDGAKMAKAVVARHLRISEEPAVARVSLQRDCIPQYTVGHWERMAQGHKQLESVFDSRLTVAGSNYLGVGVNDCIRSAYEAALCVTGPNKGTGLNGFAERKTWVKLRRGQRLGF